MRRRQYLLALGLLLIAIVAILVAGNPEDYLSLLIGISATMFGVFLALDLANEEGQRIEKDEFYAGLEILDLELEHNLSILGKHRNWISRNSFNFGILNTSIVNYFLDKPATVRHGGKVLRQALLSCRSRVDSYMAAYSRFEALATEHKGLPESMVMSLRDLIAQTEFIIVLLRTLITKCQGNPDFNVGDETYQRYRAALELEKQYRSEDLSTAYERLMTEIAL